MRGSAEKVLMTNQKTLLKDVLLVIPFFVIGAIVGWLTYRPYCVWFTGRLLDEVQVVVMSASPEASLQLRLAYVSASGLLFAAAALARVISGQRTWWFPAGMLLLGLGCSWALAALMRPKMEPVLTTNLGISFTPRPMLRVEELHLDRPPLAGAGAVLLLALGLRVLRKAEENA